MAANKFLSGHSDRIIKVCGNCYPDNIRDVAVLSPMLMGFIFYEKSPRNAIGIDPEIIKGLPHFVRPVAVFVNAQIDSIEAICSSYGIGIIQLHGNETPQQCKELASKGYRIIKAVSVTCRDDFSKLKEYEDAGITMFLFDTPSPQYGGTGKKFDWALLKDYPLTTPYLLSGGIGEEDTDAIISAMDDYMAGIDVNSRFETAPGYKDIKKLTHFIISLRQLNEHEPTGIPFWEKE